MPAFGAKAKPALRRPDGPSEWGTNAPVNRVHAFECPFKARIERL